jgi:hypothetical protein
MNCGRCGEWVDKSTTQFCPQCDLFLGQAEGVTVDSPRAGDIPGQSDALGLRVTISPEHMQVVPGATAQAHVTVKNVGARVEQVLVDVRAKGGLQPWVRVHVPKPAPAGGPGLRSEGIVLFPGTDSTFPLEVSPPRSPDQAPGTFAYHVTVTSSLDKGVSDSRGGSITVAPFGDVSAALNPAGARARAKARFRLTVENDGNVDRSVDLSAYGDDAGLRLEAPAVAAAPPGRPRVLNVVARTGVKWFGPPETRNFSVRVTPNGGEPRVLRGAVTHVALLPGRALAGAVVTAALGAVTFVALTLAPGGSSGAADNVSDVRPVPTQATPDTPTTTAPSEEPTTAPPTTQPAETTDPPPATTDAPEPTTETPVLSNSSAAAGCRRLKKVTQGLRDDEDLVAERPRPDRRGALGRRPDHPLLRRQRP